MRLLNGSDRVVQDRGCRYRIGIGPETLDITADDVVDAVQDAQQRVPAEIRSIIDITPRPDAP